MPTLFRLLLVLGILGFLVYGGMIALVTYVKVAPHEISEPVVLPKAPK